jgi:FtsZ-binding cell division protein ZapB
MQIAQFDRLKQLVKECTEQIYSLKLDNNKLKRENERLREQIAGINVKLPKKVTEKYKTLEQENIKLRDEQQIITSRLVILLDRVKSLTGGVES